MSLETATHIPEEALTEQENNMNEKGPINVWDKSSLDLRNHPAERWLLQEEKVEGRPGLTMEVWAGDLYTAMSMMIDKMHEPLKNGEYGVILGEDASGRIPTLVMRHLIRRISEVTNNPEPAILFYAGSTHTKGEKRTDKIQALSEYFAKNLPQTNETNNNSTKRALVVTDTISTGSGLDAAAEALKIINQPWDVATVGVSGYGSEQTRKFTGSRFYSGKRGTPRLYKIKSLSGVSKDPYQVMAQSIRNIDDPTLLKSQELINHVREQVKVIGDLLFDQFYKRLTIEKGNESEKT